MIQVVLTRPLGNRRQFAARTGGGHQLPIDDKDGAVGPKPIELVAAGLAGCTAGVEVERKAVEDAIRRSEEKDCSVGAMIHKTAQIETTCEIREVGVEKVSKVAHGAVE